MFLKKFKIHDKIYSNENFLTCLVFSCAMTSRSVGGSFFLVNLPYFFSMQHRKFACFGPQLYNAELSSLKLLHNMLGSLVVIGENWRFSHENFPHSTSVHLCKPMHILPNVVVNR